MIYHSEQERQSPLFFATAFSIFILSPLTALPYIIYGVYRRNKGAMPLLALFLGIVAYLTVPTQDLYRHSLNFFSWEGKPFDAIKIEHLQLNGFIVYLYQFMANNGIPFEYIRLFFTAIAFLLLSNIWKYKLEASECSYSYNEAFLRFCVFFLYFDFFYTVQGVRFGFALSIYLYGVHKLIDRNKQREYWLLFTVAGCFHSAIFLFGILTYILFKIRLNRLNAIIMIIIVSVGFNILFLGLASTLIGRRMDWYFSEKSVVSAYSNMTTIGAFVFWSMKMFALPFAFLLWRFYKTDMKWCKMALSWFVISLAFMGNAVLLYRAWWGFMAIGAYMLLEIEQANGLLPYNKIRNVLICGLLFFTFNAINSRSMLINSNLQRLFAPVPYIHTQHYSKEWTLMHIDSHGVYKNNE